MHDARCSTFDVRCTIIITLLLLQYKQRLLNFYASPTQSTDRLQPRNRSTLFPRRIFARPILALRLCLCVCMVLFVCLFICLSVYLSVMIMVSLFPLPSSLYTLPSFSLLFFRPFRVLIRVWVRIRSKIIPLFWFTSTRPLAQYESEPEPEFVLSRSSLFVLGTGVHVRSSTRDSTWSYSRVSISLSGVEPCSVFCVPCSVFRVLCVLCVLCAMSWYMVYTQRYTLYAPCSMSFAHSPLTHPGAHKMNESNRTKCDFFFFKFLKKTVFEWTLMWYMI